jgi:hypothetical protein
MNRCRDELNSRPQRLDGVAGKGPQWSKLIESRKLLGRHSTVHEKIEFENIRQHRWWGDANALLEIGQNRMAERCAP